MNPCITLQCAAICVVFSYEIYEGYICWGFWPRGGGVCDQSAIRGVLLYAVCGCVPARPSFVYMNMNYYLLCYNVFSFSFCKWYLYVKFVISILIWIFIHVSEFCRGLNFNLVYICAFDPNHLKISEIEFVQVLFENLEFLSYILIMCPVTLNMICRDVDTYPRKLCKVRKWSRQLLRKS